MLVYTFNSVNLRVNPQGTFVTTPVGGILQHKARDYRDHHILYPMKPRPLTPNGLSLHSDR